MKKGSEKQRKKYRIPLFAAACIVFLIVVSVLYSITGERMVTYYYETQGELALISVSPSRTDGVSQDATIVLEWNRSVSPELADAVTLSPSVRGEWFVSGNYLMFTPRQFAAGTYYSVTIPKGTMVTEDGEELKEAVFFSFETEDPNLRLPSVEAFAVDGRGFVFSEKEAVAIPVTMVGEKNTVEVALYRGESSEAFIDAFAELFSYPAWATLSIARYRGEEKGFERVSDSELAVRRGNDGSYVDLGSLPRGQYLVRITAGEISCDVPLTVSPVDIGVVSEDRSIGLWSHVDGQPYADTEVLFGGKTYTTDDRGFVSLPCTLTARSLRRDPSALALTIRGEKGDMVYFLTADDLEESYDGALLVTDKLLASGGFPSVGGTVFTENGIAVNGRGVLRLESAADTVGEKKVRIENGCFRTEWDDLSLVDGDYTLKLFYDGREIASESFRVGEDSDELVLAVEKSEDTVESGHSVRYDVTVTDRSGAPVTDAVVSMNGENGVAVDQRGKAVFRRAYSISDGLSSVQKNACFHVTSAYGHCEDVVASVSVVATGRDRVASPAGEAVTVEKERLPLALGTKGLAVVGEEDAVPQLTMTYYDHDYTIEIPGEKVTFSLSQSLEIPMGEPIIGDIAIEGAYRLAVVSLCRGRIPDALCSGVRTEEGLFDQGSGTLEEQRVFFSGEAPEILFSAADRRGDYYLRVAVEDANGSVFVKYASVKVEGVTVTCPAHRSFEAGSMVTLDFAVSAEEEFDYVLTLGEETYTGECNGDFSVFTEISATGQYKGQLTLYREENAVATADVAFEVYRKAPMFTAAVPGYADGALYTCLVKDEVGDALLKAFEIMDLPGDQILQRMGKTLYYRAFGDTVNGDLSDCNEELFSFQNSDGSFGRYIGAPGDILLSVFVAEQEAFACDRDSLCAYLKYRLKQANDPETAALACWGLSCFGVDCSEAMAILREQRGLSDRVLLYLAEGYAAADCTGEAEEIYQRLEKELIEKDGMLCLPESEDQYNIANTAFMLDLALKLEREEAAGLLDFLLASDIRIQSGRYLLLSAIVRTVASEDILPAHSGEEREGYTPLSVTAKELGDVPTLATSFVKNGEAVSAVALGDTAELQLQWTAEENSIYLVYVTDMAGAAVVEKDGLVRKNGCYEYVTNGGGATITFTAEAMGDGVAPRVYIVDLTTGHLIGRSDESGWRVTK